MFFLFTLKNNITVSMKIEKSKNIYIKFDTERKMCYNVSSLYVKGLMGFGHNQEFTINVFI